MNRTGSALPSALASTLIVVAGLAGCDTGIPSGPTDEALRPSASMSPEREAVCHFDSDAGAYIRLDLVARAAEAHRRHGDAGPGEPVPAMEGYAFDEGCQPEEAVVAELRQLTPVSATYETGPFTGSGEGEVTGNVIPVDIVLTGDRVNDSGCQAADFAGLDFSGPNDIALIQRGTCNSADKAHNARLAGAEAVVIFNQGNTPEREGLIVGNASLLSGGGEITHDIPVVGASFDAGVALAQPSSTAWVLVQIGP